MEDLELGEVEFGSAEEFLFELRNKFRGENKELVKVAELKRMEQGRKTMEEFMQEFRRAVRKSKCKGRALIK